MHVWHSRDDELLSFKQSIDVLRHLDNQVSSPASSAGTIRVQIPEDGVASVTTVDGEKKSIASMYGRVNIHNNAHLHADFVTLKVSAR